MNPDDFEQRLQRQPLRRIPPEWRDEILASARVAERTADCVVDSHELTFAATIRQVLWPSTKTWGALAAVWLAVLAVNFSLRDEAEAVPQKTARQTPEVILALRQQHKLLAELMGQAQSFETVPSKPVSPRPRSERRDEILAA